MESNYQVYEENLQRLSLPLSCEPAAIQSPSAWRTPDTGQTSQRNPANKTLVNECCEDLRQRNQINQPYLVV